MSNNLTDIVEGAVKTAIQTQFTALSITVPITGSDIVAEKPAMPYIFVHADQAKEKYPGSGIFESIVSALYRSHVKEDATANRSTTVQALNNFTYSSPLAGMNLGAGFFCYGIVPQAGSMAVNQELKCYEYSISWLLHWMPRNNP